MREDEKWMRLALEQALLCGEDVPVGAVVVKDGAVIAAAGNRREAECSALAHAEMLALRDACAALHSRRLHGCTLYVTLEPCPMCAGALTLGEVDRCVFGAYDPLQGCCGSLYDIPQDPAFRRRVPCEGGVLQRECAELLSRFFADRRQTDTTIIQSEP